MDPSFFGPQLSALFILSGPSLKNQRWDIRGGQISVIEQVCNITGSTIICDVKKKNLLVAQS
jgi:hypothetical protein